MNAFHDGGAYRYAVARVHLRFGDTVHPHHFLVVHDAPKDIVLGLLFRTESGCYVPRALNERSRLCENATDVPRRAARLRLATAAVTAPD